MQIEFSPLIPFWPLVALAVLVAAMLAFAIWRGLAGWVLRALAAGTVVLALAGPVLRDETRVPLGDIYLVLVDDSASQSLPGRQDQTRSALADLRRRLAPRGAVVERIVPGAAQDGGTRLYEALSQMLTEQPQGRVAGIFVISDGLVHDAAAAPDLPAPLHVLRTGRDSDWDRRLTMLAAPTYGILGEELLVSFRIDDLGAAPDATQADLLIAVDGAEPRQFTVPLGQDIQLPFTLPHGGENILSIETPVTGAELTGRNNAALVRINGVRDRLRVLLVSGEPHAGERTWRNLLKADPAVDLVHFTILRPAEKQDGVPADELSLIAFPTQELFMDKITQFDLIVFDRYRRRDILPATHFQSMRNYVEQGGAILVAAGPAYAGVDSIYRSALGNVLPAAPTAQVLEQGFRPEVTDEGARHPVTRDLPGAGNWGRWMRMIDLRLRGTPQVIMQGPDGRPLLVLDRVGEGRVALLASDQAWLWDRGFEGGGPQAELLRRLAHWLMKEPELEEETLTSAVVDGLLRVERRTLGEAPDSVTVTRPDGTSADFALREEAPGLLVAQVPAPDSGIYRLESGGAEAVAAVGPVAPREFIDTIATGDRMRDHLAGGAVFPIEDGIPRLRDVRPGRVAAGAGWAGVTPRDAAQTTHLRLIPVLPAWAWLLLSAGLMLWAWLREGRR